MTVIQRLDSLSPRSRVVTVTAAGVAAVVLVVVTLVASARHQPTVHNLRDNPLYDDCQSGYVYAYAHGLTVSGEDEYITQCIRNGKDYLPPR